MTLAVGPDVFRELCGRFATGVVVVTTTGPGGDSVGMTANSFTSVSLNPPLISVNIDRSTEMYGAILAAPRFAVNILERGQEALSRRFSDDHPDRFAGVGHDRSEGGLPLLAGTLAALECERHVAFEAGDHTIVVGRVIGGRIGAGMPLLYYRGGYGDAGLG